MIKYILVLFCVVLSMISEAVLAVDGSDFSTINNVGSAEVYSYDPSHRIRTHIGVASHTRISFPPYTIKEVIGDGNKYKVIKDSFGTNIFILPKANIGEQLDITLITSGGRVQDFSFVLSAGNGTTIQICNDFDNDKKLLSKTIEEARHMLVAMIRGDKDKYEVIDFAKMQVGSNSKRIGQGPKIILPDQLSEDILNDLKTALEVRQVKQYNYNLYQLKGLILSVKNVGNNQIDFNEQILTRIFPDSLMISSGYSCNKDIKPGKNIAVYVILKNQVGV